MARVRAGQDVDAHGADERRRRWDGPAVGVEDELVPREHARAADRCLGVEDLPGPDQEQGRSLAGAGAGAGVGHLRERGGQARRRLVRVDVDLDVGGGRGRTQDAEEELQGVGRSYLSAVTTDWTCLVMKVLRLCCASVLFVLAALVNVRTAPSACSRALPVQSVATSFWR